MFFPSRQTTGDYHACFSRRNAIRSLALFAAGGTLTLGSRSFAAEVPLAIKGYDPVAYFTDAKPTPGLPEIEYEWDEHRYRFATAQHRELFKADPGTLRAAIR